MDGPAAAPGSAGPARIALSLRPGFLLLHVLDPAVSQPGSGCIAGAHRTVDLDSLSYARRLLRNRRLVVRPARGARRSRGKGPQADSPGVRVAHADFDTVRLRVPHRGGHRTHERAYVCARLLDYELHAGTWRYFIVPSVDRDMEDKAHSGNLGIGSCRGLPWAGYSSL